MVAKKKKGALRPTTPLSNSLAARIAARFRKAGESLSLERLVAELDDESVARYDIVAALKELEKAGEGEFSVGQAGKKARFVWARSSKGAAVAAPVRSEKAVERLRKSATKVSVRPAVVKAAASAGESSPLRTRQALEHHFHLRSDFVAVVRLPADVTRAEVERFSRFLQALPFDAAE